MLNYLQDIKGSTPIPMLPSVINHNNKAVADEFAWLYDSEHDRLIRSLYSPEGSVKAHFGEFVNLSAEYITVKNTDSLLGTMKQALSTLPHNDLDLCWSSDEAKKSYTKDTDTVLCHDSSVIAYGNESVYQALSRIDETVRTVQNNFGVYVASMNKSANDSNPLASKSTSTQYSPKYIGATDTALKKAIPVPYHRTDISQAKMLYMYYTIANLQVDITDKATAAIDTDQVNIVIDVNFEPTNPGQEYYEILLDRERKEYVRVSKNPLNRLQLKSMSYDGTHGTKWKVYSYSVVSKEDIQLVYK